MRYILYMEVNGNPRIIETDDPTKISSYIHYIFNTLVNKFEKIEKIENHGLTTNEIIELLSKKLGKNFRNIKVISAKNETLIINSTPFEITIIIAIID